MAVNPLEKLERRVAIFGNHNQKYLFTINRFKDSLIQALKSSGKLMQVHLWRSSFSPAEEMKIIRYLSEDVETNNRHLACYYALQHLHMTFRNLDILALGLTADSHHVDVYHRFMMNSGQNFRELTAAYLDNQLKIYLPPGYDSEYCICSVGTRADQDDIDIGIITADDADLGPLNCAFRKITQNMLVYATPLHHHLSEHVGENMYTSTISEYEEYLESQIRDVVIISELVNAKLVLGSERLFEEFKQKVILRYYYDQAGDNHFHEGFLRGILGESRALLMTPPQTNCLAPKDDAIRLLKANLAAKKTIWNIEELNTWDIILNLMLKEPHLKAMYDFLFKATSFLELFKFLLQLFIVQEDTFRLDEIDSADLSRIAIRMGYTPVGMVTAWDQLIIDYYRYIKDVRKYNDFLIEDVSRHLSYISVFKYLADPSNIQRLKSDRNFSLPRELMKSTRFFRGLKYWEDLMRIMNENSDVADMFINGFETLDEKNQKKVIQFFVRFAIFSPTTMIRLLTILGKRQRFTSGETIFKKMNKAFLEYIATLPRTTERLSRIFSYYPEYIHEYLQVLPESHYDLFNAILDRPVIFDELKVFHAQFKDLYNIHRWSSRYFHRFLYRLILNHPEHLKSLTDMNNLSKISSGLLAMVDLSPVHSEKKKYIGEYYDLEFLRIGIGAMHGVELGTINREFTEFCDNYLQKLFDICTGEIEQESSKSTPSTDNFAILAAGGHARREAFDDDYDLIAIVDTDDEDTIRHATKVITRMNREILKRGLLPHFRLGEILGSFVNPISQIIIYLSSGSEESFIDLSQLLVSRTIIGSDVMRETINTRILKPFIFDKKAAYLESMKNEINNRHNTTANCAKKGCNIKEARGGLRDVEAVFLMLKAASDSYRPAGYTFFDDMKKHFGEISTDLESLKNSVYFLRTIRNLYRITEAAEDIIQPGYLTNLATIFKQNNNPEYDDPQKIYAKIRETLISSTKSCKKIITYLRKKAK